jgi:mannose-6-phosphate isomerase-like protein (cupin superfamily)
MDINAYIASGILEAYVLGIAGEQERAEVEKLSAVHAEIRIEIAAISAAMEKYAMENAVLPHAAIKPLLMATIDYTERLQNGESPSFPPVLNENSKPEDYYEWVSRPDMHAPGSFEEIFAKIIGYTPQVTSAIVWIKHMAPQEVHDDEHEKFLILEGSCDIIVGDKVHQLVPGDYFAIPLHASHEVRVTSSVPCKVILQRVAA